MSDHSALTELIRRGRRRQILHLLMEEVSFAGVLAFGGAILLLLLGTQILNWYWLVLLFGGSLAAGIYHSRRKFRSPYQVAQAIDARLGFHDALSTALFFSQHFERAKSPQEFVDRQRQTAEDLARSADLRQGVPFFAPRTFYLNAVLALVVCGMFGLRYGINRSLDLRPSLVRIAFDGFLGPAKEVADAKKGPRPFDGDGHRENGMPVDPWQSKPSDLDPAPDGALQTVDTPDVNNPDGGSDAKSKASANEQQTPGTDPLQSDDKGESQQPNKDANGDPNASPDGGQQSNNQSSQKNASQSSNAGDGSSLSDKMRDALANLMAKLKMQPRSGEGKQGGQSSQNNQQQANKNQSQDPNASTSAQQSDANSAAQSQGQQAQNGAQQQTAQGKSDGRSSDKTNTQEGKSGIGKQDGDKTAREAEQLAAMGKISELIGKRSANVSGEVMVEVASGKQQLKTQYSQRKAAHAETGGEINRDEVPLAYQQYVQQYFEEIRKAPAAKGKPDNSSKTKTSGN